MKVHLELFVRGATMERKECYEEVQICKTEMDKERKGKSIFSCFFVRLLDLKIFQPYFGTPNSGSGMYAKPI